MLGTKHQLTQRYRRDCHTPMMRLEYTVKDLQVWQKKEFIQFINNPCNLWIKMIRRLRRLTQIFLED
jgi:hypothetical protein